MSLPTLADQVGEDPARRAARSRMLLAFLSGFLMAEPSPSLRRWLSEPVSQLDLADVPRRRWTVRKLVGEL